MRMGLRMVVTLCLLLAHGPADTARAENLCINGDFSEVTANGLPVGWVCDFAWMNRSHWMRNEQYIEILKSSGPHRNVLALRIGSGGDESVIASSPIPFDPEKVYTISLDARADGAQPRMYIRGYKWKSGIRPHPKPHLRELQDIFRGKPFPELGGSWRRYSRKFPYFSKGTSSALALKHLKKVRFIVLYITIPGDGKYQTVFVDNVDITAGAAE